MVSKLKKITGRVEPSMEKKLKRESRKARVSQSEIIRRALKKYLK